VIEDEDERLHDILNRAMESVEEQADMESQIGVSSLEMG